MKYKAIEEEKRWWERRSRLPNLSQSFHFVHNCVRSRLYDTLVALGCSNNSSILDVGCGSGESTIYAQRASENIVGVDISIVALRMFRANGFQGILADVKRLPFPKDSFDYVVCSGLLHHLIGQGNLAEYLNEFVRVTKQGGLVIALEPNLFNHSGFLMNIFNKIKPGITGLVPHERALSPLYLAKVFKKSGLEDVKYISASYVWNRFPLCVSKFISRHDEKIRFRRPFSLFGWWEIVYGQKGHRDNTLNIGDFLDEA